MITFRTRFSFRPRLDLHRHDGMDKVRRLSHRYRMLVKEIADGTRHAEARGQLCHCPANHANSPRK